MNYILSVLFILTPVPVKNNFFLNRSKNSLCKLSSIYLVQHVNNQELNDRILFLVSYTLSLIPHLLSVDSNSLILTNRRLFLPNTPSNCTQTSCPFMKKRFNSTSTYLN